MDVQHKLKDKNKPQSDTTLKGHAKSQMLKVPHMQKAVNKRDKNEDKDGKATFIKLRDHFLAKDRINYHNKNAIGAMGITNSIKNIYPRVKTLESDNAFLKEALTKGINQITEVQQNQRSNINQPESTFTRR